MEDEVIYSIVTPGIIKTATTCWYVAVYLILKAPRPSLLSKFLQPPSPALPPPGGRVTLQAI